MAKNIVKDFLYEKESYEIRGAVFEIWKSFRGIFKERVIDRALKKELESRRLSVETQKKIDIYYKGEKVGEYIPDQIINDAILIEIKVKPYLTREDERQFWYYLRGSQYKLGFLINFGSKKLEIRRRVYDKARERYKNISVNQRTYQRISASKNGFTLIEILVVTAVALILSSILLVNLRGGEKQYAQERSLHKIGQDLRRAENLSLSAQEFEGQVPKGGYGFYFKIEEKDHYILFADIDADGTYNAGDGLVENIKLEKGAEIQNLSSSPLTITFLPPDPTINIRPVAQTATITLNNNRRVSINSAGLIEIE